MDINEFVQNAKLRLNDDEQEKLAGLFNSIFEDFKPIVELNLSETLPLINVSDTLNAVREDIAIQTISRDELQLNAPEIHLGSFVVPKTVE